MKKDSLPEDPMDGLLAIMINVHPADRCKGTICVIHNRTFHKMRNFPVEWYYAEGVGIVNRICPHKISHPDPDQFEFLDATGNGRLKKHSCDGCCI